MPIAKLYHGTSLLNLLQILQDGVIRPDLSDDGHRRGLSLSRSLGIAEHFAAAKEKEVHDRHGFEAVVGPAAAGVVLVFNRAKLRKQVELAPVRWGLAADEQEERALGYIAPVEQSLVAINIGSAILGHYEYLAADETFAEEVFSPAMIEALHALDTSPLRADDDPPAPHVGVGLAP